MSRMLHNFPKQFQWPSRAAKNSMQHERDMERAKIEVSLIGGWCKNAPAGLLSTLRAFLVRLPKFGLEPP